MIAITEIYMAALGIWQIAQLSASLLLAIAVCGLAFVWMRERTIVRRLLRNLEEKSRELADIQRSYTKTSKENELLHETLQTEGEYHKVQAQELALMQRTLQLLDVELSPTPRRETALQERPQSKEIVFQLQVDSRAKGAGLASPEGLSLFWSGDAAEAEGLSSLAVLLERGSAAWTNTLGQPWETFSWGTPVHGFHFVSMGRQGRALGIAGPPEAPWGSLRKARLKLIGRPEARIAPLQQEWLLQERRDVLVQGAHSGHFATALLDWHHRWGADAVAVFDGDGNPLATTEPYVSPVLGRLAPYLLPFLRRAWWKRWSLETMSLRMSSADKHFALRALEESPTSHFVMTVSSSAIEDRALEALARSLRWSLNTYRSTSRQNVA